jgi:Fic family protein
LPENKRILPGGDVCLPLRDPLLCAPEEKAERETRNALKQLGYIEELTGIGVRALRESHVREFHRLAVEGIFPCGGEFRSVTRTADLEGGDVTHVPPEPALVAGLVVEALDEINRRLDESRTIEKNAPVGTMIVLRAAAYALWRFNWIHPFAGGNGRTARALAYLVMTIDFGSMIPGVPSMPTLIAQRREAYEAALREADAAEKEGTERLDAMYTLVGQAMIDQLQSAFEASRARAGEG